MSAYTLRTVPGLHDPITGALVGFLGSDGQEYLLPALDQAWRTFQDASSTPGNATVNASRGRVAIAAGTSTVTVTNSYVTANSVVVASQVTADATLNNLVTVTPTAGAFTVTGNANATGNVSVNFIVLN
jgi:hypothetical protein